MLNRAILWFLLLFITAFSVLGATLYGKVYDYNLNSLEDVIIVINTTPKQIIVTENSSYSINIPPGTYTIVGKYYKDGMLDSLVTEKVTIRDVDSYRLDLILFPDFTEESELLSSTGYAVLEQKKRFKIDYKLAIIIIAAFLGGGTYLLARLKIRKPKERTEEPDTTYEIHYEPDISQLKVTTEPEHEVKEIPASGLLLDKDLQQLLAVIQQNDGRTTQKDIRKQVPWCESKVSLMITELEQKGIIEKIKKGRGNIIVLKK